MGIVKTVRFLKPAGRSRIYEIDLIKTSKGYLVNYRYGWEGSELSEGTRTADPISLEEAEKIVASLSLDCQKRGFFEEKASSSLPTMSRPVLVADGGQSVEISDRYSAGLLSQLEQLSGLSDEKAARLLFSISKRQIFSALPHILDLTAGLDVAKRPATARILPYILWILFKDKWSDDITESLHHLANQQDGPASDAARLVLAELAGDIEAGGFSPLPELSANKENGWSATNALINRLDALGKPGKKCDKAHETILTLYAISRRDKAAHTVLLSLLRTLPFRAGLFRSVRRLYKATEAFGDAEIFAQLVWRFETLPPGYSGNYGYDDNWNSINLNNEVRKAAPTIAFGKRTRDYLIRRTIRHLRSLGGFGRTDYVNLAAACLMEHKFSPVDFDVNLHMRNYILGGHEGNPPFTDLWSKAPGHLLEILLHTSHEASAEFAADLLKKNLDYCNRILTPVLARLFASDAEPTRAFALWTAQNRIASGQLDLDLLCVLATQADENPSKLFQAAISMAPEKWLADSQEAARLLVSIHPTIHGWLRSFLETAPLDEQAVLTALATWLKEQSEPDEDDRTLDRPAFDKTMAKGLASAMSARFASTISLMPAETLLDLFHQENGAVQLFVLRLSASRKDAVTLFDASSLARSDDPELQAGAAQLLANANHDMLKAAVDLIATLLLYGEPESRSHAADAVAKLVNHEGDGCKAILPPLLNAVYQDEPRENVHEELAVLFGLSLTEEPDESGVVLQAATRSMGPDVIWSLIRARTKLARRLGTAVLQPVQPDAFSLRKIARIGVCDQKSARDWAVAALQTRAKDVERKPQEIFALLDGKWDDSRSACFTMIRAQGAEQWPDEAILALCDCVSKPAQAFGRELLTSRLSPDNAVGFLTRLAEHPGQGFLLTIARLIRDHAGGDTKRLRELEPAIRRMLQRVHASRAAKEQLWRFIEERIAQGVHEDHVILQPILMDMSASIVRADRDRAIAGLVQLRRHANDAASSHMSELRS